MASIKTGAGVALIRGSIGGTVFSQNANGAYSRNRSKGSNPNTIKQQFQRNSFGAQSRAWKTLSEADQQTWVSQAPNYPYINRLGETGRYTGFQLYVKVNNALNGVGVTPLSSMVSPTEVLPTATFELNSLDIASSNLFVQTTFAGGSATIPTNCKGILLSTGFLSSGVYRPKKSQFRKAMIFNSTANTTNTNAYGNVTAVTGSPTAGNVSFLSFYLINTVTGQTSNPVDLKLIWV